MDEPLNKPLQRRRNSCDPSVQGSSAWLHKLSKELNQADMTMIPNANVLALDPEVLKRDVFRLQQRLNKMQKFLLNPHSRRMQVCARHRVSRHWWTYWAASPAPIAHILHLSPPCACGPAVLGFHHPRRNVLHIDRLAV